MRRWWALVAIAAAALAMGGCGNPAGVDGDLTNAWPAFAKAQTPTPVVGACYPQEYDVVRRLRFRRRLQERQPPDRDGFRRYRHRRGR